MKTILPFIKKYRAQSILAPLFKMLEALLELFVPLVVKNIIDIGIGGGDKIYTLKMCGLLGLLALIGLVFSITAQYFAAYAATGITNGLKSALFSHVMSLGYTEADTLGTSTLITRITGDADKVQNGINLALRLLLRSPFVVFGAVIMAFTVDTSKGTSAWIFAGAVPVLAIAVFGIMLGSMPLYAKVQKSLDKVTGRVRQHLTGVRVLRAFGREESEKKSFSEASSELNSFQRTAGRVSALMNPITYVLINGATILLIYTSALRVDSGILSQGAVVALYNYMAQILVELIKLADLIINISKALASAKRIGGIFAAKNSQTYPENGVRPDFNKPAVEMKNVSFTYKNAGAPSLTGVNFTLNPGEKTGVTGSTGSGKSTLVNLIPRFYDCTEGEVRIFGHNVRDYSRETLNSLVAVVPQKAVLFKGTIRENLLWGNKNASDSDLEYAINAAQCADIISAKKDGLDEIIEQNGANLSGGQRQRLTIARALVKKSPIIILDDSASALDFATDARLSKALSELYWHPAVITVSLRTGSIRDAQEIIVLEDGAVAEKGTHTELAKLGGVYSEINSASGGDGNG